MLKTRAGVAEEQHFILSTVSPSPAQKWLALAVVLGISLVFALIIAGPLRGVQPGRVDAFVPAYATAIILCDSITALLLYSHFSIVRSRAILVIARGYLFAAMVVIPWVLAFPGLFGSTAFIGGMQTTSYLYFFRHAGFTLFVMGYALSKDGPPKRVPDDTPHAQIAVSIGWTMALALGGTLFFILGDAR